MKSLFLFVAIFFTAHPGQFFIAAEKSVLHYCEREQTELLWKNSPEYAKVLHELIDVMDEQMDQYLQLAKLFKPFIKPIIKYWAECRKVNSKESELVKWSESSSFTREQMYKNTDSFAKLENLLREISLFMMDLSIQSKTIREQCKKCALNAHRYVRECLLETPGCNFTLPGFSMIEKLQVVNSERVIAILTITGSLLYGS